MFQQRSIQAKILVLAAGISLIIAVVGGIGVYALSHISEQYGSVAEQNLPRTRLIWNLIGTARKLRIDLRNTAILELGKTEIEKSQAAAAASMQEYAALEKEYQAMAMPPEERKLLSDVTAAWKEFEQVALAMVRLSRSSAASDRAQLIALYPKEGEIGLKWRNVLIAMSDYQKRAAAESVKRAEDSKVYAKTLIIVIGLVGALLGIIAGFFFSRFLAQRMQAIAQTLMSASESVNSTSRQVYTSSESLAATVSEQAAALQETSSTVEELNSMVQKTSENSAKSRDISAASTVAATEGKASVNEAIVAIEEIDKSTDRIITEITRNNQEIAGIVKLISEIGDKTKVINDIVFQTKLLSFNASVEAARAGESGKGFAVVAEEIGSLAQMSGKAAEEIGKILGSSTKKVEDIVQGTQAQIQGLVQQSKEKVDRGVKVTRRCGEILDGVVKNVEDVDRMVKEVATASQEQSTGIIEISKALSAIEQANQQNATSAQTTATASMTLSREAEQQRAAVSELLCLVQGGTACANESEKAIDFDSAITAHVDWKMKLNRYLENPDRSLNPFVVGKDDQCALGKWIHGQRGAGHGSAEFEELKADHAEFHRAAARVIELANQGDQQRARAMLAPEGEFVEHSKKTVGLIERIRGRKTAA